MKMSGLQGLSLGLIMLATGCYDADNSENAMTSQADIPGIEVNQTNVDNILGTWELYSVDGVPLMVLPYVIHRVNFGKDGKLAILDGCNEITGEYEFKGNSISTEYAPRTKEECPYVDIGVSSKYRSILQADASYKLAGDALIIDVNKKRYDLHRENQSPKGGGFRQRSSHEICEIKPLDNFSVPKTHTKQLCVQGDNCVYATRSPVCDSRSQYRASCLMDPGIPYYFISPSRQISVVVISDRFTVFELKKDALECSDFVYPYEN